jgi:peptidoglycan hydrolase CwlO-like protein
MKNNKNSESKKDIVAEIREEFKRHATILMEHMTKEVKTVAEGHSALAKKLEDHDKRFDRIESDLTNVKSELHKVKSDVSSIRSELTAVSAAVMDTSQSVKAIEKKIGDHETRITKAEEKVFA